MTNQHLAKKITKNIVLCAIGFGIIGTGMLSINNHLVKADNTFPSSREAWKWPFAQNSIWNTPIGSNAQYSNTIGFVDPKDLPNTQADGQGGIGIDEEPIYQTSVNDPLVDVYQITNWSFRCNTTNNTGKKIRVPSGVVFADPNGGGNTPNYSGAFVQPDKSVFHFNAIASCGNNKIAVYDYTSTENDSLYKTGHEGGHGGSGLSGIGGSIRLGELTGTEPIRHAIKFNVYARNYLKQTSGECSFSNTTAYKWPANRADAYSGCESDYYSYKGLISQLKIGALTALPPSVTPQSLGITNPVSIKLFYAFQNYGGYIVDDTHWNNFDIDMQYGVPEEVNSALGINIAQPSESESYYKDTIKIIKALTEVTNNTPTSIGGGGTPRQSLAPCFVTDSGCVGTISSSSSSSVLSSLSNNSSSSNRAIASSSIQSLSSSNPNQCQSSPIISGRKVKIMLLGDSTTQISEENTDLNKSSTFRKKQWQSLMNNGFANKIDFLGWRNDGNSDTSYDNDHMGMGGFSVKSWFGGAMLDDWTGAGFLGISTATSYSPDIVQINLGTNDQYDRISGNGSSEAQVSAVESRTYWGRIIDDFRAVNPSTRFLIVLSPTVAWTDSDIANYHQNIIGQVITSKNSAESPITTVDLKASGFDRQAYEFGGNTADGTHQNSIGATIMANTQSQALTPIINSLIGSPSCTSSSSNTTLSSSTSAPISSSSSVISITSRLSSSSLSNSISNSSSSLSNSTIINSSSSNISSSQAKISSSSTIGTSSTQNSQSISSNSQNNSLSLSSNLASLSQSSSSNSLSQLTSSSSNPQSTSSSTSSDSNSLTSQISSSNNSSNSSSKNTSTSLNFQNSSSSSSATSSILSSSVSSSISSTTNFLISSSQNSIISSSSTIAQNSSTTSTSPITSQSSITSSSSQQSSNSPISIFQSQVFLPNFGDGNYDGIQDSLQTNIRSIQIGNSIVTIQTDSNCSNMEYLTTLQVLNNNFIKFLAKCPQITIKAFWHGLDSNLEYDFVKYNPDSAISFLYNTNAIISKQVLSGKTIVVSQHTVFDNQIGDFDPRAGYILDPFALRVSTSSQSNLLQNVLNPTSVLTNSTNNLVQKISSENILTNSNSNFNNIDNSNSILTQKTNESPSSNSDSNQNSKSLIRTGGSKWMEIIGIIIFVIICFVVTSQCSRKFLEYND